MNENGAFGGIGGMILIEEDWNTQIKPVPLPICSSQIPNRLAWDGMWLSMVQGQSLTAWTMAQPTLYTICIYFTHGQCFQ